MQVQIATDLLHLQVGKLPGVGHFCDPLAPDGRYPTAAEENGGEENVDLIDQARIEKTSEQL